MCELKRALDAKGNGVLEMPTGTGRVLKKFVSKFDKPAFHVSLSGKTVTLFSLITSPPVVLRA